MLTEPHISDLILTAFRSGVLSAEATIICAEHLDVCPECSGRYDQILQSDLFSRPLVFDFSPMPYSENEHLGDEQLSDYLAGVLGEGETEIINIHVEACADCRTTLLILEEEADLEWRSWGLSSRRAQFPWRSRSR